MKKIFVRSVLTMIVGGAFGCGSAPSADPAAPTSTPPVAPAPKPAAKPAEKAAAEPAATDRPAASAEGQPQAGESSSSADGLRKASRPPGELITTAGVLYVFNFNESAVGSKAKEECDASSGGAKDKLAACLQKARAKVPVESIRFVKKPNGEYFWVTNNRYKGNLLKWHVIQFEVGEEKSDRVTLKLMGKDKGIAPMPKVPRSLEIELPNDYSIVVLDSEFGRMTYDAKIGAVPED